MTTDAVNFNQNVVATNSQAPVSATTAGVSNPVNNNSIWASSDPYNLGLNNSLGTNSSLFSTQPSSNFQGDIMMSGMDFDSLAYDPKSQSIVRTVPVQTQQAQQTQVAQQPQNQLQGQQQIQAPAISGEQNVSILDSNQPQQNQGVNFSELDNYLVKDKQNKTSENGISWKTGGALVGGAAPLTEKLLSAIKDPKVLKSINWKQMAVTCPIIALAGFGVGSLLDNIFGKKQEAVQQVAPNELGQSPQPEVAQIISEQAVKNPQVVQQQVV